MRWLTASIVAVLLVPVTASAQQDTDRVVAPSTSELMTPQRALELQLQGGVQGSTGALGSTTRVGPSGELRVAYVAFPWLSIGANYGFAGQTSRGSGGDATLVNQSLFGDVRVTGPFGLLRPYAFAGFGYGFTRVHQSSPTPLSDSQIPLLPVGVGATFMLSNDLGVGPQVSWVQTLKTSNDPVNSGNAWNAGIAATLQTKL